MKFDKELTRKLLVGLAYGDAIGVTTEFFHGCDINEIYAKYEPQGWPFKSVGRTSWRVKAGEHTDDTDMAWAIVKSVHDREAFISDDIADRFVDWYDTNPKDIGNTTRINLAFIKSGNHDASKDFYKSNPNGAANGSLMRNGVINGFADDLDEAFRLSWMHGIITHYAPLPVMCCAMQTWIIHKLLNGERPFIDLVVTGQACGKSTAALKTTYWVDKFLDEWGKWVVSNKKEMNDWLDTVGPKAISDSETVIKHSEWNHLKFDPFDIDYTGCAGYCLLTMQIAVWALRWSFETDESIKIPKDMPTAPFETQGVKFMGAIPMIGYDADTYAATAGPLFVAEYGEIPDELTKNLQIHDWWNELVEKK